MMENVLLTVAILLLLTACGLGWALALVGMPGNWLMVASVALYAWFGPQSGVQQIGWSAVAGLAAVAAAGELAEFAASMLGARKAGGSRRAAVYSLVGSLAGALTGATLGIPVPVIGSAVAAVAGGALGALAGAALGEISRGQSSRHSLRVGRAAFWGRLLGTAAKSIAATIMVLATFVALVT